MNLQNQKCVMLIDARLPMGIIANTAAILGAALGKKIPELVGENVTDRAGKVYSGIVTVPIPVLNSSADQIKNLRRKLYEDENSEVTAVDFFDLAQACRTYEEYIQKMRDAFDSDLNHLGLAIFGPKKKVEHLTGNLPLLR